MRLWGDGTLAGSNRAIAGGGNGPVSRVFHSRGRWRATPSFPGVSVGPRGSPLYPGKDTELGKTRRGRLSHPRISGLARGRNGGSDHQFCISAAGGRPSSPVFSGSVFRVSLSFCAGSLMNRRRSPARGCHTPGSMPASLAQCEFHLCTRNPVNVFDEHGLPDFYSCMAPLLAKEGYRHCGAFNACLARESIASVLCSCFPAFRPCFG